MVPQFALAFGITKVVSKKWFSCSRDGVGVLLAAEIACTPFPLLTSEGFHQLGWSAALGMGACGTQNKLLYRMSCFS
ncbi:hypothetical protein NPIL_374441 [Nephila pilipes]|uniref:Uncharacterized protein n=1 Tax=Nephila pilipes TaxID=299642 RepID=A0A8X6N415_NEPPI|nr:hypothetical protein NPIL_374441 [Nephila pilipes]